MKMSISRVVAVTLLAISGLTSRFAFAEEKDEEKEAPALTEASLPAPVLATVKSVAPGSTFVKAELENEDGVKAYEVKVKEADGHQVEVKVSPDGQLAEIEEKSDLPASVAETAKHLLSGGKAKGAEKSTVVLYEIKKEVGESTYELCLDATGSVRSLSLSREESEEGGEEGEEEAVAEAAIPPAAMATVKRLLPGGVFEKASIENEDGAKTYEVKVKLPDGRSVEAMVRANGELTETEEQVTEASLPAAVAATLKDVLPAGKTVQVEKKMAVLYEVKKEIDEVNYEVVLNASGEVESIRAEHEEEGEEHEGAEKKENGEKEENEKEEKGK